MSVIVLYQIMSLKKIGKRKKIANTEDISDGYIITASQ